MPPQRPGLFTNSGVGSDGLLAWAERTGRRPAAGSLRGALRFAFYGRVSTEDYQDPVTSRARQVDQAGALVAGHGQIVAHFFDVGQRRVLPWARRPQAAALVAAMADPDRAFDAIVVGEYERAFYGSQYALMAPLFEHYGVQLWMPEAGGLVDFHAEGHEAMMIGLGIQSKREITRTRIRVRTAMAAQTRDQGRYLGGRPPYGYLLADAGPHPNRAHAAWGRRARRLETDQETATVVRWIFAQRLAGHSVARITRALNEAGIPCPSAADPGRNTHRAGLAWSLATMRAILANPRYTGRQVWNRQPSAMNLIDPANTGLGHRQVQRWGPPEGWVISARPSHPALVSEEDFIAVRASAPPAKTLITVASTGWPGSCGADSAGGGLSPAGRTAGRPTGAATGIPAPAPRTQPGRRTSTSVRTTSCRTCLPCSSAWPERKQPPGREGAAPGGEPTSQRHSATQRRSVTCVPGRSPSPTTRSRERCGRTPPKP